MVVSTSTLNIHTAYYYQVLILNSPDHQSRGVLDPGEISHAVKFQSGMTLVMLPGGPGSGNLDASAFAGPPV